MCGRGTDGYGTILPAVLEACKAGIIGSLLVATRHSESFSTFDKKLGYLNKLMGTAVRYEGYSLTSRSNVNAYRDAIRDLLSPAAVIIATPDHLHTEMALAAIERGNHVMVVKPLAPTVSEARKLIYAAENAGVYGAVEFHKRWDWANLKLKSVLSEGRIGEPLYFHVEYSQRKLMPTQIFADWVEHTNIFQYLGVHYVDLIHFVTGAIPKRVLAIGQRNWLMKKGIPTYDAIEVLIEWSKGFTSTILTHWVDPNNNSAMSQQMIKAIGTAGNLSSDQTHRGVQLITDEGGIEDINPYFCQVYPDVESEQSHYRGYGIESITQFLNDVVTIATGAHTPIDFEGRRPTFRSSLVSTAVIEAVNLSLIHRNRWFGFDEDMQPSLI
mgnify:CR=1 FL=1